MKEKELEVNKNYKNLSEILKDDDNKLTKDDSKTIVDEMLKSRLTIRKMFTKNIDFGFYALFYFEPLLNTLMGWFKCCKDWERIRENRYKLGVLINTKRKANRLQSFSTIVHSVHRGNVLANSMQTPEQRLLSKF